MDKKIEPINSQDNESTTNNLGNENSFSNEKRLNNTDYNGSYSNLINIKQTNNSNTGMK